MNTTAETLTVQTRALIDAEKAKARLAERARLGRMLEEHVARGDTAEQLVAFARSLLKTDY